jgi:hypothetical protein
MNVVRFDDGRRIDDAMLPQPYEAIALVIFYA